jgi:ubiquinone/menaquinone biosynthesis C-methylase UbiE
MFGFGSSERAVEIPWCLNRVGEAETVLDVGTAHADLEYLRALAQPQTRQLYGIDLAQSQPVIGVDNSGREYTILTAVRGDVRSAPFADNSFQLILCISTLEHVGMDNTRYCVTDRREIAAQPDNFNSSYQPGLDAMCELYRITQLNGRLLITLPFGKDENHGWFQQYDFNGLVRLLAATDFRVVTLDFFRYHNGWQECVPSVLKDVGYQTNGVPNTAGLVCAELQK